jgi:hypothetical protein
MKPGGLMRIRTAALDEAPWMLTPGPTHPGPALNKPRLGHIRLSFTLLVKLELFK